MNTKETKNWDDSIFQGIWEETGIGRVEKSGAVYHAYIYSGRAYVHAGIFASLKEAKLFCENF